MIIPQKLVGAVFTYLPFTFQGGTIQAYIEEGKWGYLDKTGKVLFKSE